jgi:hypothetical protein
MPFNIGSPLTIQGNKGKDLLAEYEAYKIANPNTATSYQDYVLMKEASGGLNTTLTNDVKPTVDVNADYTANNTSTTNADANGDGVVTKEEEDYLSTLLASDLATVEANKKYLIGNAIGQSVLNMSNLSNAFADKPTSVGIGAIPNVQYPNVRDAQLAELQQTIGKYRSGISSLAGQKGLSPDTKIGAEANVLAAELAGRAKIAEAQNTNDIAETTANATINQSNIENQYASKIAAQTRNDEIEAQRSLLVQQGLTNVGKIGAGLAEGNIALGNQKNQLGATNYYMGLYQDAIKQGKFDGTYDEFIKFYGGGTNAYTGTMSSATNKELVPKTD